MERREATDTKAGAASAADDGTRIVGVSKAGRDLSNLGGYDALYKGDPSEAKLIVDPPLKRKHQETITKKRTLGELVDEKVEHWKVFLKTVKLIQSHPLLNDLLAIDTKGYLRWAKNIHKNQYSLDAAIGKLFENYQLDPLNLPPEEYAMIRRYFECFVNITSCVV